MKQVKKKIKGIIFDLDGTLIDTEDIWKNALERMLENNGVQLQHWRESSVGDEVIGKEMHATMEVIRKEFSITRDNAELVAETFAHARQLFQEDIKIIEGFHDFHTVLLEADVPTSIATNCDAVTLDQIVKKLNFREQFGNHIYCIAHVDGKAKPDPTLFLHAAEQIGVKPEECLVFEDSYWGFMAAKAAGMQCIAIKNSKNKEFFDQHAYDGIDSYDQALDVMRRLVTKL